ncbi:hypothetical protein Leryth_008480 [Lithospermum erythrorhizon]|nr:hypothetical protein Leryth_008480 [Lithospermum erythrorhizon]
MLLDKTVCSFENPDLHDPQPRSTSAEPIIIADDLDKPQALASNITSSEPIYEAEVIENFLRSSASQLTVYGLFCLQDGMKERELCVFFRNNHFNTMFKVNCIFWLLTKDTSINQI